MYSPDLFEDDDQYKEEEDLLEVDRVISNNIRDILTRTLPPPECRLSIGELLSTYKENLAKLNEVNDACENIPCTSVYRSSLSAKKLAELQWPESFYVKGLGLHYNRSDFSEDIESMSLKLVQRFIGSETLSSYSVLKLPVPVLNELKVSIPSPRRRLSHLAKRRDVFSSVNLKCNSFMRTCRQIPVALSKGRYNLKGSTKRNNIKDIPKQRISASQGTLAEKYIKSKEVATRALFQSPPTERECRSPSLKISDKRETFKRTLLFSPDKEDRLNVKRQRVDYNNTNVIGSTSLSQKSEASSDDNNILTYHRKQKLLWAVATALKNRNISSSHQKFKKYAHELSKAVKLCFQLHTNVKTSSTMNRIANSYVCDVMNEKCSLEDILQKEKNYVANLITKTDIAAENRKNTMNRLTFKPYCENSKHLEDNFILHNKLKRTSDSDSKRIEHDTILRENIDTQMRQKSNKKPKLDENDEHHQFVKSASKVNKLNNFENFNDALRVKRQITFDI